MTTALIKYRLRRDTAAHFTSANPTLALGEPAYETDSGKLKIGDGTSDWGDLDYLITQGDQGDPGQGIPTGGSAGEFLVKLSSTNFDVAYRPPLDLADLDVAPSVTSPDQLIVLRNGETVPELCDIDEVIADTDHVSKAGDTMTGALTTTALNVSGVTGSALAAALKGRNTSGAPASAAHSLGDMAVDNAGVLWICTTAGTPGTFTAAGASLFMPFTGGTFTGTVVVDSAGTTGSNTLSDVGMNILKTAGDTAPEIAVFNSAVATAFFSTPGAALLAGPGGSSAPDVFLARSGAGVWSIGTSNLLVGTASAAGHALSRSAGDARFDAIGAATTAQAAAVQRANHTGTQLAATVSDFATAVAVTSPTKANNLSDLASLATARTNLGLGVKAEDAGTLVHNTNAATTLYAGGASAIALTLSPAAGTWFIFEAHGAGISPAGTSGTLTIACTVAGTAVITAFAESIAANISTKHWWLRLKIRVVTAGASGALSVGSDFGWTADSAETNSSSGPRHKTTSITSIDLTSSKTVTLTATPSTSAVLFGASCAGAFLERQT